MYELMCIEAALVCVATLLWASPEVGGAVHGRTRCHHNTPLFINTHILSSRHILYHHDTHSLNTPTQTHPPDPPPPPTAPRCIWTPCPCPSIITTHPLLTHPLLTHPLLTHTLPPTAPRYSFRIWTPCPSSSRAWR